MVFGMNSSDAKDKVKVLEAELRALKCEAELRAFKNKHSDLIERLSEKNKEEKE